MRSVLIPGAEQLRLEVPIVPAVHDGHFVELSGDREPDACDHAGAHWAHNLDLFCPRCGAPMFLPAYILAGLPVETINRMHELWIAAGWPRWQWTHWWPTGEDWVLADEPLFRGLGGLPVRADHYASFLAGDGHIGTEAHR